MGRVADLRNERLFPTARAENTIAIRDNDYGERDFGIPYYENDAASKD